MKKCPWKKILRVKKPKKPEKSARENEILPVKKNEKLAKKGFHAHLFFHAQKKNTEVWW